MHLAHFLNGAILPVDVPHSLNCDFVPTAKRGITAPSIRIKPICPGSTGRDQMKVSVAF